MTDGVYQVLAATSISPGCFGSPIAGDAETLASQEPANRIADAPPMLRSGGILVVLALLVGIPMPSIGAPTPTSTRHRLAITSTTFSDGEMIPVRSALTTCGGSNRSPDLSWSGAPGGTRSYVVAVRDLDAPAPGGFWHWLLFNIPVSVTHLAEGVDTSSLPGSVTAGTNDFGRKQYGGPCPRVGDAPHRYRLMVIAVDLPRLPGVGPNTTGAALRLLLHGHVLGFGRIEGRYAR